MHRPDGRRMDLGQVPATDPQGMAGWTGHVTPHDGRLFGAICIGGVRRGGTPAVMTEAAWVGPVSHAPALGRGLGGSPAATTAALGAVSGALIGAAMGAGPGLATGVVPGTMDARQTGRERQQQYDHASTAWMYASAHQVPGTPAR